MTMKEISGVFVVKLQGFCSGRIQREVETVTSG